MTITDITTRTTGLRRQRLAERLAQDLKAGDALHVPGIGVFTIVRFRGLADNEVLAELAFGALAVVLRRDQRWRVVEGYSDSADTTPPYTRNLASLTDEEGRRSA